MARVAYITRLPTGHTHSDIDAVFAIIWKIFWDAPCVSLQAYQQLIEKELADSALGDFRVFDCMIVPDYKSLSEGCIDSKLGLMHKEIFTQHQWRLESVDQTIYFQFIIEETCQ